MSVLNIAGPEYDFASVVFAVVEECEHRRRGFDDAELAKELMKTARAKVAKIKQAYDEFGGSAAYWQSLEKEVLETAMPQYIPAAREMNLLERSSYGIWRAGDPMARATFGLSGLVIGGVLKALPFIPTIENIFVFLLAGAGFIYPEIKRYNHERRHVRMLNRLVADAARYQKNAKLHYMTSTDIRESFHIAGSPEIDGAADSQSAETKETAG